MTIPNAIIEAPPKPAIFKLNHDVMLHILYFLAPWNPHRSEYNDDDNFLDHLPLRVIMRASQVCVTWRRLILNIPAIWGRCFNLNLMNQKHDHFRYFVISRAQGSLLSVLSVREKTLKNSKQCGAFRLLVWLLQLRWNSIRYLNIAVDPSIAKYQPIWKAFGSISTNLKVLSVNMDRKGPELFKLIPSGFQLFSNQAPCLVELYLPDIFTFKLDFKAASARVFSDIRDLNITLPSGIQGADLLAASSHMSRLERIKLKIDKIIIGDLPINPSEHQRLSMPLLSSIVIRSSSLSVYSAYLEHITPRAGCALSVNHFIDTKRWHEYIAGEIPNVYDGGVSMQRVFERYAVSYFEDVADDDSGRVDFMVTPHQLLVFEYWSYTTFGFSINCRWDLPSELLQRMLNAAATFDLPDMDAELYLSLNDLSSQQMTWVSPVLNIASMSHITELDINANSLCSLDKILNSENVFPDLETIYMNELYGCDDNRALIMPFLQRRHNTAPVKLIHFSHPEDDRPYGDLRFLDKLHGLKITWGVDCHKSSELIFEYVCGTGDRDKLLDLGDNSDDIESIFIEETDE